MQSGLSWQRRELGSVIEQPIDHPPIGPPDFVEKVKSYKRYEWQAPYQLTGPNLANFKLALDCYVNDAGIRRFTIIEPSEAELRKDPLLERISTARKLAFMASWGGYLLLRDRGELDSNSLLNPDEARILLQHIQGRREYLHPRKNLPSNLGTPGAGRLFKSIKNILPDDFGRNSSFEGVTWTTSMLMKQGVAAAQQEGVHDLTPDKVLSYGLWVAAQQRPTYIASQIDALPIVRMSLFSVSESDKPVTEEQLRYVAARVRSALAKRWSSNEEIHHWIKDEKGNVIRSISKSPCPMPRKHVRKVLLELGWQALQLVGKCVDTQMRAFRDALATPLNEIEEVYFSHVFLANPYLGGLPLILLRANYDVLEAAILDVWQKPGDREALAVLYSAMYFYKDMLLNRRIADSNYKRRSPARADSGGAAIEVDYPVEQCGDSSDDDGGSESAFDVEEHGSDAEVTARLPSRENDFFLEIAIALARKRGYGFDWSEHEWHAKLQSENTTEIVFDLFCPTQNIEETISVSRGEFEETAREIRGAE